MLGEYAARLPQGRVATELYFVKIIQFMKSNKVCCICIQRSLRRKSIKIHVFKMLTSSRRIYLATRAIVHGVAKSWTQPSN